MVDPRRGALAHLAEVVDLVLLLGRLAWPETDGAVGSWTGHQVLLGFACVGLGGFLALVVLARFGQLVSLEGIELNGTGGVVPVLCCDLLPGFDGEDWSPLLLVFRAAYLQSDVVVAGAWDLIAVVLAGIREIDLLAHEFQLSPLFGPLTSDAVVVGRGRVILVFSLADEVEVSLPGGSLGLELGAGEPERLFVALVWMGDGLLAGPGELLSLIS